MTYDEIKKNMPEEYEYVANYLSFSKGTYRENEKDCIVFEGSPMRVNQ